MRRLDFLLSGLMDIARQFGSVVATTVEDRLLILRDALRIEVRHVGATIVLAMVLAACVILALICVAAAILMASWDTHRVLATSLVGVGFIAMAIALGVAMRR